MIDSFGQLRLTLLVNNFDRRKVQTVMRKTLPLLVAALVLGLGGGLVATSGGAAAVPVSRQSDVTGVMPAATATPMMGSGGNCC